jgi:hypothetical protein
VALAAVATLPACTPAERPVTALRLVDGHPTLVIESCPDFHVDGVRVFTTDPSPAPGGVSSAAATRQRWVADRTGGSVPGELRLLEASPGWSVSERSLTAFAPGKEYVAWAFDQAAAAVSINFTLAELAALGPDDVLVGRPSSKRAAVSESRFREEAKESC